MTKPAKRNPRPRRSGLFYQEQLSRLSQELAYLKEEADARLAAMKAVNVDSVTIDGPAMAIDALVKIKTTLSRVDAAVYEASQERGKPS